MDGFDLRGLAMDISRRLLEEDHGEHEGEHEEEQPGRRSHSHGEDEGGDPKSYLGLRIAGLFTIMFASALGFLIPVIFTKWKRMQFSLESRALLVGKAFSAGVVVATALVHMLPVAEDSFNNTALPNIPWGKFPWAGALTTLSAFLASLFDFVATARIEKKHGMKEKEEEASPTALKTANAGGAWVDPKTSKTPAFEGKGVVVVDSQEHKDQDWEMLTRRIVVAEILEYGVVSHSVLIGITLGVLTTVKGIRPLLIALVFHQFFEGIALGACGVQARFKNLSLAFMCLIFSLSTGTGIMIGILVSEAYDHDSQAALLVHGFFDSLSAGILLYNGLVSLLGNDFFSKRMKSDCTLQVMAYIALFAGGIAMSVIGIWG